jgi:hypothetical protein
MRAVPGRIISIDRPAHGYLPKMWAYLAYPQNSGYGVSELSQNLETGIKTNPEKED